MLGYQLAEACGHRWLQQLDYALRSRNVLEIRSGE